ncbi:hypothetical protein PIB30_067228 [Stylosanthes scabra]|uniref:Aminotransferase-like plant mobile domain-containing protein n=1 Tax=Stylosanthes scabra TaxID=79078 RepID=A0ABU6TN48_9FABA|nr:hypothetical protein [Stylosanthes scabra]
MQIGGILRPPLLERLVMIPRIASICHGMGSLSPWRMWPTISDYELMAPAESRGTEGKLLPEDGLAQTADAPHFASCRIGHTEAVCQVLPYDVDRGYLLTDKSNNLVHIRWLPPLMEDFARCSKYSWGFVMLAWPYRSLSSATCSETTDLGEYVPLIMSWIYYRFPAWGPAHLDVIQHAPAEQGIIRLGGFLHGDIDSIDAAWIIPHYPYLSGSATAGLADNAGGGMNLDKIDYDGTCKQVNAASTSRCLHIHNEKRMRSHQRRERRLLHRPKSEAFPSPVFRIASFLLHRTLASSLN